MVVKKMFIILLLVLFQVTSTKFDEMTTQESRCLAHEISGSNQETVRHKKKCKCFCCIKASCAAFDNLFIAGSTNVAGALDVGSLNVGGIAINTLIGLYSAPGIAGATGAVGIAGPTGPTGATGPAGASGLGLTTYGYVYNLTAQTIAIEAATPFDSNGPLVGITHAPGSSDITIVSAGTYVVIFSVSGTEPNQFAIAINGTPNVSTVYGSGAGTQQNTGLSILTLASGDVLTLINHSSAAAVGLASVIGGTQANVNASVLIVRLT